MSVLLTPGELVRVARITYRQLTYWISEGALKPARRDGNGATAMFDFLNVIEAMVIKSLRERGLTIRDLRSLIEVVSKDLPTFSEPREDIMLITDGLSKCVIGDPKTTIEALKDLFEDHSNIFAVPIGDIWNRASLEVKTLKELSEPPNLVRKVAA